MGLLGTKTTLPMYEKIFLGIKSSTTPKKCPGKAVAHSVEVRGKELEGTGRSVRLVLLTLVFHTPSCTQRSAFPKAWPWLASIHANATVGPLLSGLGIPGISAVFLLSLEPGAAARAEASPCWVSVWAHRSLRGWRCPRTAPGHAEAVRRDRDMQYCKMGGKRQKLLVLKVEAAELMALCHGEGKSPLCVPIPIPLHCPCPAPSLSQLCSLLAPWKTISTPQPKRHLSYFLLCQFSARLGIQSSLGGWQRWQDVQAGVGEGRWGG